MRGPVGKGAGFGSRVLVVQLAKFSAEGTTLMVGEACALCCATTSIPSSVSKFFCCCAESALRYTAEELCMRLDIRAPLLDDALASLVRARLVNPTDHSGLTSYAYADEHLVQDAIVGLLE